MTAGSEEFLEKALSAAFALDDGDGPTVPSAPRPAAPLRLPERIGRYPVEALVGRGGIGLVLRCRDVDLGRPIALKILHEHLASDQEMVRRFVDEARVEGALEHPGVVPVHEMGRTEDGRPYFTMKLVEGETLARKLAERKAAGEDRLGFLSAFEKVCQIVAYAHARGVVHLDLKPSNVLVGGFGEILVTDWGFATDLSRTGPDARSPAAASEPRARIVGTPAYMAPEQARGDVARIGRQSDVFALGAMLCEILTGTPAYEGDSATELLLAASRGWLDDAFKRLDACGADDGLVGLARRCLASEPGHRPADAGIVASQMDRYLRSLEERAQTLAIEAAEAKAHARAEQRQRKLVVALTIVGALAVVLAGGGWLWVDRARAAHMREDDRLAAGMAERVRLLADRARNAPEPDPALWDEPCATAHQALDLARVRRLPPDVQDRIEKLVAEVDAGRSAAVRDAEVLNDLISIHERLGDLRETGLKDRDYGTTFRALGADVDTLGPERAAALIAASPIRAHLVSALDEWAHVRRNLRNPAGAALLMETANRVDPDAWRVRVRAASATRDVAALEALAAAAERRLESAESQIMLATSLKRVGKPELAGAVLDDAAIRHPGDYGVHHELGMLKRDAARPDLPEAIRHFSMALALRPGSAHAIVDLGQVLLQADRDEAGRKLLDEALRLDPAYAPAWHYLGAARLHRRDPAGAVPLLQKAADLDAGFVPTWIALGMALRAQGRLDEAAASYRQAGERDPGTAEVWCELGHVLIELGRFVEARDALRKCHELGKARGERWTQPSARWLEGADRLIDAEKELAGIGETLPERDINELYELAEPAFFIGRPATAARIMELVLSDTGSGAMVPFSVHLFAARAAAAAGTGAGKEAVDEKEAASWRKQALAWLRAALESIEDLSGADREGASRALQGLLVDRALSGLRDPGRTATLAPDEAQAWQALWERIRRESGVSAAPESR